MDFAWLGPPAAQQRRALADSPPRELRPRRRRRRRPAAARAGRAAGATASGARSPSARWPTAPRAWPARWRARGVARGDVVMTLIGNRPEWVYAMVACFRLGAVALPCTEQLRPADLRARMDEVEPGARSWPTSATSTWSARPASTARSWSCPDERLFDADPAPAAELEPDDPALIIFTSGTAGEPKPIRHGAALPGGPARPGRALVRRPAGRPVLVHRGQRLVEVGAQRLRRAWLRGAAALLHDARFDPDERLDAARARARERALHGPDRVPGDREARRAAPAARAAPRGRRRRAAQPGGRRDLAGGGRACRSTTATARPRPAP